jgi:uncharacterized protein (TIGR03083 family)
MKQQAIVQGLTEERERFISFLRTLPDDAWTRASKCEGWAVRDVVSHLAGNVSDSLGQRLDDAGSAEYNQRQVDERAGMTPAQILDAWEKDGRALEDALGAMPEDLWGTDLPQISSTLGEGVLRLLEDLWVHAHDVRLALGEKPLPGPGLVATHEVAASLWPERFERLAPSVGRVVVDAGDLSREVDTGRGTETVTIQGDPAVIALAATGRVPPQGADGMKVSPPPGPGVAEAINIYAG